MSFDDFCLGLLPPDEAARIESELPSLASIPQRLRDESDDGGTAESSPSEEESSSSEEEESDAHASESEAQASPTSSRGGSAAGEGGASVVRRARLPPRRFLLATLR